MYTLTKTQIHAPVVEKLKILLSRNSKIKTVLQDSLHIATMAAKANLNTALYQVIDKEFNGKGWPKYLDEYYEYLDMYVQMIPNERNNIEYPNAWTSDQTKNGYNQKVYDLLCHFYWLINQKIPGTRRTLRNFEKFSNWLADFSNSWSMFLDTEASLTPQILQMFKDDPLYNFDWYNEGEQGWKTFNQFFYRSFNGADPKTGISPLRPIAEPKNNEIIVAPADCTFKQYYPIDPMGNILNVDYKKTKIYIKRTHTIGKVSDLLRQSKYAEHFNGGTFVHYFLSPFDYHRFHTPVSGEVLEIAPIEGKVYLNVEMDKGQFYAPDGAGNGYEFTHSRGVAVIDGGQKIGKIAILPIGMCMVSGVDMYTDLKGKKVIKGQEFGKFRFGGSDIIMLFEKKPEDLNILKEDPVQNPIHFQYGQTAVYLNESILKTV